MEKRLFAQLKARLAELQRFATARDSAVAAMASALGREWPALADQGQAGVSSTAEICVGAIATIPTTVERLEAVLDGPGCSPALRHAIVIALVYLVRRDDLVPDDTPGGYGLVDDWMILSLALVAITNHPSLRRQLVAAWSKEPSTKRKLEADVNAWRKQTMDAIGFVMAYLPPARKLTFRQLFLGSLLSYDQCEQLAATNPQALERRTTELIENPDLPASAMTGPVDDAAVWKQWEERVAAERLGAERMAETRAWMEWSKKPSRYVSDYVFAPLPGGGYVGARRR